MIIVIACTVFQRKRPFRNRKPSEQKILDELRLLSLAISICTYMN